MVWPPQQKDVKILDLGSGAFKIPGSIGLDIIAHPNVDVVHHLDDFPYPFENDTFDAVYLNHVVEHLQYPKKALEECLRIVRPDGAIYIMVAHFTCANSYGDVTHLRYFSYRALPELARNLAYNNKLLVLDKMRIYARIPVFDPFINLAPRFWEDYYCFIITGKTLFYRFKVK
jgi:SAM-dependent methyltransferase